MDNGHLNSCDILHKHRKAFLIGTFIPGIVGLFLAEAVMAIQFNALQPILRFLIIKLVTEES
jgi:hypothetical protein